MENHEYYIRKCIELALKAKQKGESPVGAILVREGQLIAEGIEEGKGQQDITCHAEIEVIRNFRTQYDEVDLSECILYTTHEPCIMCSYVLRHHKVGTVVWGISTGEIGGASSDYPILSTTQIPKWGVAPIIIKGVLEEECIQTLY